MTTDLRSPIAELANRRREVFELRDRLAASVAPRPELEARLVALDASLPKPALSNRHQGVRCLGVYEPAVIRYRVLRSPGRWASAICPGCGHDVSATRPTKGLPYSVISAHYVKGENR